MAVNADVLVQIVPRVMSAGTSGLKFSGLFLTKSELPPTNRVLSFTNAEGVGAYFGTDSDEYRAAVIYFNGYLNTQYLPSYLYFAKYSPEAEAAWLRGAKYAGTLADLQKIKDGSIRLEIDGIERAADGIDLTSATSFSDCAERVQAALSQTADIPATAGVLTGGVVADFTGLKQVEFGALTIEVDGVEHTLAGLDFTGVEDAQGAAAVLNAAMVGYATAAADSTGRIAVTSNTTGSSSTVSYASTPAPDPDLSNLLGLGETSGASITEGTAGVAGTAGTYTSGAITVANLTTQTAGTLDVTVDGELHSLTALDFQQAEDLADVATVLGDALTGHATVAATANGIAITSATTGAGSTVAVADPVEGGTGLAAALACTAETGGQAVAGKAAVAATTGKLTGGELTVFTSLGRVTDGTLDITVDGEDIRLEDLDFTGVSTAAAAASVLQTALSGKATVSAEGNRIVVATPDAGAGKTVGYATDPSYVTLDIAAALCLTQATGAKAVAGTDGRDAAEPTVSYSSQTGAFQITSGEQGVGSSVVYPLASASGTDLATVLNLTEQLGAIQSEGTDGSSLTDCMTNTLKYARDWVSFSSVFEPALEEKIELAQWCASYDTRFAYVMWDTDNAARVAGSTASAGYRINHELELSGTICVYNTLALAAGVMGAIACVNFEQYNGRLTLAYRQFEGVDVTCDDDADYDALVANGYNCYADFATAAASFKFFQNGQVSGVFEWADSYLNAVGLKDQLQLNILDLFAASRSIPYNEDGYSQIRTACLDTITRFLDFGAIRSGVTLSNTQKIQLLQELGKDVSQTLTTQGWYMQITDPGAQVRSDRGTPNCYFYYTDGGSIQRIVMSATCIQ